MDSASRRVIIGLDGVPFEMLERLAQRDVMPHTGRLINGGVFRRMSSTIPEVSSVAWSSVITGSNPGQHGIFGFTELPINTYRLSFPNFNSLRVAPFWERDVSKRCFIVNVPSTFPARAMNGIMLSGFVALDLERAVYPSSLLPMLRQMDYRIDVDSGKAHQSMELFLRDLDKTLEARISVYRYLWGQQWDTFMLVFTGTDRLMHFLWDAYTDINHEYHESFINHFRKIDEVIGEILRSLTDEDTFIVLSDHGFETLTADVHINAFLKQNGFLKLSDDIAGSYADIDCGTRAFGLDPGRIYLNMEDRYPKGAVREQEREGMLRELEAFFGGLQQEGRKVIKKIYRKEELYRGPYLDFAPDLILLGEEGFNLKAGIGSNDLFSKSLFTGKHRDDNAFLLVRGRHNDKITPAHPSVTDIIGLIDCIKRRGR